MPTKRVVSGPTRKLTPAEQEAADLVDSMMPGFQAGIRKHQERVARGETELMEGMDVDPSKADDHLSPLVPPKKA